MTDRSSLADLLARVAVVEQRIRALVQARRADDPMPDDPFRGLYLSDDAVDRILASEIRPDGADGAEIPGDAGVGAEPERPDGSGGQSGSPADTPSEAEPLRLRRLADTCALSELDLELLLVALACDLDARFEQLFGYLNDDVTRRRPSAAVALALCGVPLSSAAGRDRLLHGPLVEAGLLTLDDPERPFPGRALRVPDRVIGHLLGSDAPDSALAPVLVPRRRSPGAMAVCSRRRSDRARHSSTCGSRRRDPGSWSRWTPCGGSGSGSCWSTSPSWRAGRTRWPWRAARPGRPA